MYGWVLLGFSTVAAFWQIFRLSRRDHQDQDFHAYAYQASESHSFGSPAYAYQASENHSFGSHAFNTNTCSSSFQNSSCNDSEDLVLQSDPSRIHYYESYPNLSTSTSTTTTKNFQLQSENVNNKSTEEIKQTPLPDQTRPFLSQSSSSAKAKPLTNASQSRLSLDNPPYSKPTLSQLQSESSNNKSREGTKPTPSSDQSKPVLSQSSSETSNQPRSSSVKAKSPETESQSPSSFKKPSSSKLTFSLLPSNSRNRHTKNNSKQVVQQGTSPSFMIPKDTENLIKKEIVAEVLKTLLCLAANKDYFAAPRNAEDFSDEDHKRAKLSVTPILELNFLDLPIRPGKKDCPYYMCKGSCKYGANCKFNHPNPTAEGDSNSTNQPTKANYKQVVKDTSPICMIPKDIENLIEKGVVPNVLKKPLSQSTYKDYFAALLYAEDFYIEKWNNFLLRDVTLEFRKASTDDKSPKNGNLRKSAEKDKKILFALKIDSVPARRPFILSRDFVFVQKSGSKAKKFQGIVYRVVKSNLVLVEFEEEFYSQHDRNHTYDVSFSFNRVWLKRAHQAISAAAVSGPLLEKYLFPEHAIRKNICSSCSAPCVYGNYKLDSDSNSAICQILSCKGHPPYLVEGPLCASATEKHKLSKTGLVVREAVLQIYQRSSSTCRILICSPLNSTGDILLRSLKSEISESVIFRANVAFGEEDEIPGDRLGKWSSFPSLEQLKQFRVIFSTFVGSFRLFKEGITAQHFSHIFLVDASSVTEPETMIPLSNLAHENTTVVLTGAPNNQTTWLRSDIARKNGLRTSYFERLRATKIYKSSDPAFIMRL